MLIEDILKTRIIAIVRMERYDRAVQIAEALVEGGISIIEFTLTGTGAYQAIGSTRKVLGAKARIGVGTVLHPQAVEEAVDAGAQFVVTPVMRLNVIAACQSLHVPILCGAFTPTEALTAHEAGADMIKIFPARFGGPSYIRDLLAPLPQLRLVPTGGVNVENAHAYIDAGAVAVAVGGNLIPTQAVTNGDWAQISAKAHTYVEALRAGK
jgi:2-dehydro-3-deoxyphosphogluconate aldolase/(4S)-4-hydroxy-2-oxoglutarate aldolase